jgi:hypothetical protein
VRTQAAAVLLVLCLSMPGVLRAQEVLKVPLALSAPKIDGKLDDDAWLTAAKVDHFYQREPHPGEEVSEKTEFLICYDRDKLYCAFRCYEKDPSQITAKEMARDVSLGEDDRVQIILDTFLDGRNGYWFQVGPRGSIGDALLSENGEILNKNWDGLWEGKARIHSQGWDAELAIPFKTMAFKPGATRWGLKLIRHIRRKLESAYWPVANLDTFRFQVSDAALMEGLEGITQGVGLEISPYGLTGTDVKAGTDAKLVGDAGLDVYQRITPGLESALTINTDFAQTEVDARQINLTRFPLFFPEKRDFFLQGSSYFSFGPSANQLIPFFSRRIGLDAGGNPIQLIWGAKLTGQMGKWNVGVLDAMDDRDDGARNFAVARVRRNIGRQSSIGFIATEGNAFGTEDNVVAGADFKFMNSRFRKNKNLVFSGFALKSTTEGVKSDDWAFGAEAAYPNDFLNMRAGFNQIGGNFKAGVGFVPRNDIREYFFQTLVGPRPKRYRILQLFTGGDVDYITDLDNRLMTRKINLVPAQVMFNTGDQVAFKVTPQYEFLDADFAIQKDHVIAQGGYPFLRKSIEFLGAQRRNLWATAAYRWGSFYNGSRRDVALATGWKVSVPLFLGVEYERDRVWLPDGTFATNISRLNANILFSPDVSLYNYLQYDNVSQTLGWQTRFRWILKPGNEVLVVWNSRSVRPLDRPEITEGSARIKLRYNYRF